CGATRSVAPQIRGPVLIYTGSRVSSAALDAALRPGHESSDAQDRSVPDRGHLCAGEAPRDARSRAGARDRREHAGEGAGDADPGAAGRQAFRAGRGAAPARGLQGARRDHDPRLRRAAAPALKRNAPASPGLTGRPVTSAQSGSFASFRSADTGSPACAGDDTPRTREIPVQGVGPAERCTCRIPTRRPAMRNRLLHTAAVALLIAGGIRYAAAQNPPGGSEAKNPAEQNPSAQNTQQKDAQNPTDAQAAPAEPKSVHMPQSGPAFVNGSLAASADKDSQTAPAKFSAKNDAQDHLPII